MIVAAAVIGLAAGLVGGLAGLGGGVVMVPLLTGWLRLPQHRAHGTSLTAVVMTGLLGVVPYALGASVAWRLAALLAVASVSGASVAAGLSPRVPAAALRRVFGILVIVTGLALPFDAWGAAPGLAGAAAWTVGLLLGGLAGALSGLLGVGGGAVMVPLLVLVFGFDQHLAQGTSLAVMVPAALAGSAQHLRHGQVVRRAAVPLAAGVAVGALVGGRAALALPETTLRLIFAVLLVATGVRYARPVGPRRAQGDPRSSG